MIEIKEKHGFEWTHDHTRICEFCKGRGFKNTSAQLYDNRFQHSETNPMVHSVDSCTHCDGTGSKTNKKIIRFGGKNGRS